MEKKPFFSVIVTEHNSAAYMRKMLGSIRKQTFTDYELIIVCDRCTDDTAKIAMGYSDVVLTVDNGRCGLSRNNALDIAKGEWILFADDDDWWLHEFAFELIANVAKVSDQADLLCFGFLARDFVEQEGLYYFMNCPVNYPPCYRMWAAPWNKAWRRSFIGDHRFPDWEHSDDLGFAREMHPLAAERMVFINTPLYYYNYMRPGSIADRLSKGELEAIE